jgi:SAM-dependent methyltransferase
MAHGRPIDRVYIEGYLERQAADIRGDVLEILDAVYTFRFGGDRVKRADVLDASPTTTAATVRGNLETGAGVPVDAYDCFICTQTLPFIFDVAAAVRGIRDVLAPGGVALVTLPALSPTSREDRRDWGDWWRFTSMSAARLFADAFGQDAVAVQAHGNVLTAAAFLYGYAAEELSDAELAHADPDCELLICVRAVRA